MRLSWRIILSLLSTAGFTVGTYLMVIHFNDHPRGVGMLGYAGLVLALVSVVGLARASGRGGSR